MVAACPPALLALLASQAAGQAVVLQPSLEAGALASNRLATTADGMPKGGLMTEWVPGLRFVREGAGLSLDALLAADAVLADAGEAPRRVYPRLDARADAVLVDRLLSVEAAARVDQSAVSPLSPRAGGLRAEPRLSTFDWRLGPRFAWAPRPGWSMQADAELSGSRVVQGQSDDAQRPSSTAEKARVRLERLPLPVGAALALSHLRARDQVLARDVLRADTARVDLGAALADGLAAYAIAGREDVRTERAVHQDGVQGARLLWQAGERTLLDAVALHRFFGSAWDLQFRHRNPGFGLEIASRRELTGGGADALVAEPSSQSLLKAMLVTRHADPKERDALARDFAREHLLLLAPTAGYGLDGTQARVERRSGATVLLVGARNSAALSVQERRLDPLEGGTSSAPGVPLLDAARSERNAALTLGHRLAPRHDVELRFERLVTRVAGAGTTHERQLLARWSLRLPRGWSAEAGMGWGRVAQPGSLASERLVFAGLAYSVR